MKHQITLLGGQILPVYIGIVDRKPNVVHILYTKETVRLKNRLVNQIFGYKVFDYQIEPYDYQSIEDAVTKIICDNEDAIFELNLTSGTKLMALASQKVFQTLECFSFYIDQNQNLIDLSNGNKQKLDIEISTKTFLALSNHDEFSSVSLKTFSIDENKLANSIFELRKINSGLKGLFHLFRKTNVKADLLEYSYKDKKYGVNWKGNKLSVIAPKFNLESTGSNSFKILTTGLWWELIVGNAVSSWKSAREIHMSLIIKSNANVKLDKNEIDILINTGQKMLFIECKSGVVLQSDINKMRAISKFYGGISSKSILVSFYKPKEEFIEKCQDFGIELFFLEESNKKHIELKTIANKLDQMFSKIEI
ncbi:Card1-like endonuclease domain-containing protein [Gelidibacter pelagius]|uniref:DUF1887 family protein n=1 Tax=Gelidibacter pelagius TaxID=2819985 RepID=A0ABS3SQ65_9FLAO|nr:DUF1887 family CARF protein [Gelidibacter pelagius]MBO3097848.1 DUF1887 family protein [Gelidibacter pelagius]